jgi:pimeloyl-ACP methyl ester carboxylesterase
MSANGTDEGSTMNSALGPQQIDVGGYRLWTQLLGDGTPTVVFESGGGDDSSVWSSVEPEVRRRKSVSTMVYDRAGLGRSEPKPGPYRINDEVAALRTALSARGVRSPVLFVTHSYGGFVSLLAAARDPRVAGLVLVDANLPGFFAPDQVGRLLERFRPVAPEMERQAPSIARVMVPLMEALPATAQQLRAAKLPSSLPIIDIVPEQSWIDEPEELAALRREHASFVAASPEREAVFAAGSSHYVMRDRPDLVVDATARLIDRVRADPKSHP